ncbi:MAG: DUF503 domain-containing protein [Acidimicrobiales bacterium]
MSPVVAALTVDVHIATAATLKDKRSVVRSLVEGMRHRFPVSASEAGGHDLVQRALVVVAFAGPSVRGATDVLDAVERWVWSRPDIEIGSIDRHWLELDI